MARKKKQPNPGSGDEHHDAAVELRSASHDVESTPGMLRRACATKFGRDVLDFSDSDLLDTVGEAVLEASHTPHKTLTKEVVWRFLIILKEKYGFVVRGPQSEGPHCD